MSLSHLHRTSYVFCRKIGYSDTSTTPESGQSDDGKFMAGDDQRRCWH
jgi:hypothetical protein